MISTKKLAYKICQALSTLQSRVATLGIVEVSASSASSLPTTISDASILANHVCVKAVLSNPSAQTDDWTVTTANGSATISGTISGSTDITLYLELKVN